MYWFAPATLKCTDPRFGPLYDAAISLHGITSVLFAGTTLIAGGGNTARGPGVATLPSSFSTRIVNSALVGPVFDNTNRQIQPCGCCAITACSSVPLWLIRPSGIGPRSLML